MVSEGGDIFPDGEVDVDVVEVAALDGAEGVEWEVDDFFCV